MGIGQTKLGFYFLLLSLLLSFQLSASNEQNFSYTGQEELQLNGEWHFYWNQILYSEDLALDTSGFKVVLPNYWNNHKHESYKPQSFGYATYRTSIRSDIARDIAIEYTAPHCAQRIFINGKLIVGTGKVGKTSETHEGLWLPGTIKTQLKQGENELIIQISNFNHDKGGLYKTPVIGQVDFLLSKRDSKLFLDSFVAGGMFIIGIFFLGLSVSWRNNRLFSYFGLFASMFSFWFINYGMHAFKVYFLSMSWNLSIHLTYLSMYGFLFFIGLFLYEAFQNYFGKYYLKIILIGYGILFSTILFGSPKFFTAILIYGHALAFGELLYAIILLINAIRMRVQGSVLGVLSILFLVLASLSVLGMFYNVFPWVTEISGILFLIAFSLLAVLMANKIGMSYKTVLQLQQDGAVQKEKIEEQATKLRLLDEMKTRFFANVSHDFRSPLTLIKGSMNKIKRESNFLKEDFEVVEKSLNQLIQFSDEIRDLNLLDQRVFKISYSAIRIILFLKEIIGMFQSLADTRNIRLIFKFENKEIVVHADEKKIRRILNNLLSNAFKFTDDGGWIELSVKKYESKIIIKLSDSGVGIATEEQPFVFDRFYQGKRNTYRSEEGMGVGLALVKELISLHGGTVHLKSQLMKGSTFSISLPYNYSETLSEREVENTSSLKVLTNPSRSLKDSFRSGASKTNQTILLVDDHHDVRRYIATVVSEEYKVIEAKNGIEAYDILKKEKIDLMITDLMMPLMDGFELIDKMNQDKELSKVKVMVVSARTTQEDKLSILKKGVNDFISKPFDEEEFNQRVSNVLESESSSILSDIADKKGVYSTLEERALLKVNSLIHDQIDNSKLTTAVIADALATSERNANRIIKKLTGFPPKSYIQIVRMDYAELLLHQGGVKSITEAGNAIGIQNVTQFAKQFEKIKGFHPSQLKGIKKTI